MLLQAESMAYSDVRTRSLEAIVTAADSCAHDLSRLGLHFEPDGSESECDNGKVSLHGQEVDEHTLSYCAQNVPELGSSSGHSLDIATSGPSLD